MLPENFTEFIDDLTSLVKKNVIPMSRIDDAVRRILRVKFTMGLFENPLADLSLVNQLGSQVTIMIFFFHYCLIFGLHIISVWSSLFTSSDASSIGTQRTSKGSSKKVTCASEEWH